MIGISIYGEFFMRKVIIGLDIFALFLVICGVFDIFQYNICVGSACFIVGLGNIIDAVECRMKGEKYKTYIAAAILMAIIGCAFFQGLLD